MEKAGTVTRSFRYDHYHHPPPPPHQYVAHPAHHAHPHHSLHQEATKLQQYGDQPKHHRTTEKAAPEDKKCRRRCCRGVTNGLCSNLGVCALLLSYTLLGSFIFMAIEGGAEHEGQGYHGQPHRQPTSRRLNGSHGDGPPPAASSSSVGSSPWLLSVSAGPRERTVESIWDITVSLNILYRENWTRLAAEEVAKFQEFLVQRLAEEWGPPPTQVPPPPARPLGSAGMAPGPPPQIYHEWNFARAFLYSLTVLTTIGYGSVSPRTALGKAVTMAYAALGIPLMLLYLSCVGGLFSRGARVVFTSRHRSRSNSDSTSTTTADTACLHACCCCVAPRSEKRHRQKRRQANSTPTPTIAAAADVTATIRRSRGYTASSGAAEYREKLRALSPGEEELKAMAAVGDDGANSSAAPTSATTACCSSASSASTTSPASSSPTSPTASHASLPSPGSACRALGLAAPIILCLSAVVLYVAAGAAVLARWERWPFLDAAYFCFMSLSTIGFGELMPGADHLAPFHSSSGSRMGAGNATVWFVSLYILAGMALTATCFNILHDEIMQRIKHKYRANASSLQSKPSTANAIGAGAASTTTTAVSTTSSVRKEADEDPYS